MRRVSFCIIFFLCTVIGVHAQNGCLTINNISYTSPTSCGATDGTITIDAIHSTGNTLQYSIDGGRVWVNNATIGGLEAGVTYFVEVRDNIGLCFASHGEYILEHPECNNSDPCVRTPFTIEDFPGQTICSTEGTFLNASPGLSYTWFPTTGLSASNIANPIAIPTSTTTYTVTVTNQEGCTATDNITITVDNDPACEGNREGLEAGAGAFLLSNCILLNNVNTTNPSGCNKTDGSITIDAAHIGGNQLQYSIDGGRTWGNNATIGGLESGVTYLVEIRDNIGLCFKSHGEVILENTNCITDPCATRPFSITDAPDQTICSGESTSLNASSGGMTYSWSPTTGLSASTIANPTATPVTTTTYTVTVTNQEGCIATDAITVTVSNKPIANAGVDQTVCAGSSAQLSANGGTSYQWIPAIGLSNAAIANPVATPSTTTTYCVTITDNNGCQGTDCITIEVDSNCEGADIESGSNAGETINPCIIGPAVVACPDKFMCPNDQAQLVVNGGIRWEWSPTTGLDDPTSASPIATPSVTTVYTVTGYDANGCTATDQVEVIVVTSGNCDVAPPPCQDDSIIEEEEVCLDADAPVAFVCLPFPIEELNNTFTVDLASGTPQIEHGCGFDNIYTYQYNFLPAGGQGTNYQINNWTVNGVTQSGVANSMQELLRFMQTSDPAGNWNIDATRFSIIGGSPSSNYGDLLITHQGQDTRLGKNTSQKPTGTLVSVNMVNRDREVLTVINLITGCTDQVIISRPTNCPDCKSDCLQSNIEEGSN